MSEYWKSQPKKFCEFCKCWITDNKPSVAFHEKGKRHQENVRLKIDELKKKGTEDARKKQKENDYLKRMEKAAMEAFKKDIASDPELAKHYNVKLPGEVVEGPQLPEGFKFPPKTDDDQEEKKEEEVSEDKDEEDEEEGQWWEVMSDMGYPYYWNTVSGETVWVAPKKYVSLADQGETQPTDEAENQSDTKNDEKQSGAPSSVDNIPLPTSVDSIPLPGEQPASSSQLSQAETEQEVKEEKGSENEDEEEEADSTKQDRNSRGVYGIWARVQQEQAPEAVDLQLPTTDVPQMVQVPVLKDEPKLKFKEKRVTLGSNKSGPVAFKKRKLGEGARNVRRRGDDD